MEGWHPVEDVVRWGFGQAPVVMANEAHSGLARSVSTDNALTGEEPAEDELTGTLRPEDGA